ncbi:AAA family ATPase [Ruania alkalisoli]|uniref:AAA family ATPase n=1 Tax=Ruania alkalisoli TaxID=2779775 RepID=A0A7M1SUU6_9MICO|nr:P-loop NTPase fold protein [Ruania alkalisoli]QOR71360.1 AAA family ATPase [Ruania alkalisoli]
MANVGDNPIRKAEQDLLKRASGAITIADGIRDVDASEGYVVAVVGPWGSGKTSIVNLVMEALAKDPTYPVIEFNPWVFSGSDELVQVFFRELAAQMRLKGDRLAKIAESVDSYGELFEPIAALPFIGAWFARFRGAAKALHEFQERRKGSVTEQRNKLSAELAKLPQPIVVVVDDIDRLESTEIRDIFKLVRLTASFPNIIYVLAFDRQRVEAALTQSGFDGRAYLEKIVQLGFDVPPVPASVLLRLLGESLQAAVEDLGALERFNESAWPDVLVEIIRPLVSNMRDISRYSAAVRATTRTLGTQVELVDIMGLEALRVFRPDVFDKLVAAREGLTTPTADFAARSEDPNLKSQIEQLLEAGADMPDVVRAVVSRLFPAARRHIGDGNYGSSWQAGWLRSRRVAHPDVLAVYLEKVSNETLEAFGNAERAFEVLVDEDALNTLLRAINLEELEDVISALEAFETEFPADAAVPASRVLLNLLPDLPQRPRGMMSFIDERLVVVRVILRLLRRLDSPEQVMDAVGRILAAVGSFSSRFELVTIVGHRENAGHKLVSKDDARILELQLREQIETADSADLAKERGPLALLYHQKTVGDSGKPVTVDASDLLLGRALLLDSQSTVRSQTVDSRSVRRTVRLNWTILTDVFDGEDNLRRAVDALRPHAEEGLADVIDLADRYLTGWRPSEWGDD